MSRGQLRSADEIWMSSSTKEILPITLLDGRPVGDGQAGVRAAHVRLGYQDFKNTVMRGE